MSLTNLFSILKGGPRSGFHGHAGRLGKRGGSSPGAMGAMFQKFKDLQKKGFLTELDDNTLRSMSKDAAETAEIYGEISQNKGSQAHTKAQWVYYGANRFMGNEWHPLAKDLQKEILSKKIPQDETLYRGVTGSHASDIAALNPGDNLILDAFSSTSRGKSIADVFKEDDGTMIVINAPKGSNALYASELASELLLPAYSSFTVTRKEGTTVYVDYIGVEDPYDN